MAGGFDVMPCGVFVDIAMSIVIIAFGDFSVYEY